MVYLLDFHALAGFVNNVLDYFIKDYSSIYIYEAKKSKCLEGHKFYLSEYTRLRAQDEGAP